MLSRVPLDSMWISVDIHFCFLRSDICDTTHVNPKKGEDNA